MDESFDEAPTLARFGELERTTDAWRLVATPSVLQRTWSEELEAPLRTALELLQNSGTDAPTLHSAREVMAAHLRSSSVP